ncbi:MAG TPA: MFS transporter [Stellaceae bacterium]|nr:MFS transporter [Stellaceae bacterium]
MEAIQREQALLRRLAWRLMPLLIALFVMSFIDRQNVGFAKLQMLSDLHMTEAVYGFGASLFFIGYLIFEVPSALGLQRYGARLWLARIICTWGLITIALGFTSSATMFYSLRFLLGVAEAGFYPGAIFYISTWFPRSYRIRVLGFFTLGSTLGNMFGGLLNGMFLDLNGALGLAGWQWVFIGTGLPAVLMTAVVLAYLPSSPETATFLSDEDRRLLADAHAREPALHPTHGRPWAALWDPRVIGFAAIYMLMSTSLYGMTYWLPTVVKGFGVSSTINGLLNMVPWGIAALLLIWLPGLLRRDRLVFQAVSAITLLGVLCFTASVLLTDSTERFVALAIGGPCISLLYPCFWSLPPRFFSGARAAASIAAINSIGNLGGFFAQNLMPWVGQQMGSTAAPMLVPAVCLSVLCLGAVAFLIAGPRGGRDGGLPDIHQTRPSSISG